MCVFCALVPICHRIARWPLSGKQTRHLSKVLHHLREDSIKMGFARLALAAVFSLPLAHEICNFITRFVRKN